MAAEEGIASLTDYYYSTRRMRARAAGPERWRRCGEGAVVGLPLIGFDLLEAGVQEVGS